MENRTLGIVVALAAGVLGAAIAVTIQDILAPNYGIIIRANNTQLTSAQWTRITTEVLTVSPKTPGVLTRESLYRIREWTAGPNHTVIQTTTGKLPEDQMLVPESAILATLPQNFLGHAFQIGVGGKEKSEEFPRGFTNMPQAHFRPNMTESQVMVQRVDEILP